MNLTQISSKNIWTTLLNGHKEDLSYLRGLTNNDIVDRNLFIPPIVQEYMDSGNYIHYSLQGRFFRILNLNLIKKINWDLYFVLFLI